MIQIKKPKYEHDNYCVCCRKPFEDSMQISFSHKNYKDSVSITLCGKCREELMEALGKDINVPNKSALDHIHNVVAENEYKRGYEQGKKDAAPKWIPVTTNPPKEEKSYLVWLDCGGVCECRWTDGDYLFGKPTGVWRWNFIDILRYTKILAWMPLPEPYKEGEWKC